MSLSGTLNVAFVAVLVLCLVDPPASAATDKPNVRQSLAEMQFRGGYPTAESSARLFGNDFAKSLTAIERQLPGERQVGNVSRRTTEAGWMRIGEHRLYKMSTILFEQYR